MVSGATRRRGAVDLRATGFGLAAGFVRVAVFFFAPALVGVFTVFFATGFFLAGDLVLVVAMTFSPGTNAGDYRSPGSIC